MKKIIYILLAFLTLFSLTSCKKYKEFSTTFFADYFNTVITIYAYDTNETAFKENVEYIETLLEKYHKLYDIYMEYSGINNICTINKKAGIEAVVVEQEIIDLIKYSKTIYTTTSGKVNIAMGSVLKLWHNAREYSLDNPNNAYIPTIESLTAAAKYTNINDIIIDEENSSIYINNKNTSIDVGAIAKGYACEVIGNILSEKGVKYYTLNFGGNIKCIGTKGDGTPWKIGIQNPNVSTDKIETVSIDNLSVVTSGSYQRYYYVGNVKYHHIINPTTLMPNNEFASVTIITQNSALGDALSTALFNLSLEEGQALIESIDGVEAMWIDNQNNVFKSNGFDIYKYKE